MCNLIFRGTYVDISLLSTIEVDWKKYLFSFAFFSPQHILFCPFFLIINYGYYVLRCLFQKLLEQKHVLFLKAVATLEYTL